MFYIRMVLKFEVYSHLKLSGITGFHCFVCAMLTVKNLSSKYWKRIPSKARTTPVDNPCGSAHNILCPATFEGISSTKILGIDPLVKKLFTFNVVKWIIVKLTSKIFRLKPGSVRCCGRYFKLPNNFICVFEGIHISRVTINNIIEFT